MKNSSLFLSTTIILCFFGGFMCFLAWNGFAWAFNLPQFSFWHWVATYTAIRVLHGNTKLHVEKGK